jgi:UDP-N-acetylglucosamine--N-acetylmuramyl-(pentapeptide) pyrophosphoryl-undecaprenol N-acetylglucosamine transferase
MGSAYSAADIAITRAGAGTLAELATCNTPAILVPYPLAADDHQTANAMHAVEAGSSLLLKEKELDGLNHSVLGLLNQPAKLKAMREALSRANRANHWDDILRNFKPSSIRGSVK